MKARIDACASQDGTPARTLLTSRAALKSGRSEPSWFQGPRLARRKERRTRECRAAGGDRAVDRVDPRVVRCGGPGEAGAIGEVQRRALDGERGCEVIEGRLSRHVDGDAPVGALVARPGEE